MFKELRFKKHPCGQYILNGDNEIVGLCPICKSNLRLFILGSPNMEVFAIDVKCTRLRCTWHTQWDRKDDIFKKS